MHKVIFGCCLLTICSSRVAAQSGVPIGTAAAGFGTGAALARDADALFWNPALIGVQPFTDVRAEPVGSLRVLSVSVPRAGARGWIEEAARTGFLAGGPREAPSWTRLMAPAGGEGTGGEMNVVWMASATGALGVSVSSHAEAAGVLSAEPSDTVVRSASTVAMVAIAGPAGRVFGMRARAGLTVKGRWIHLLGSGTGTGAGGYREFLVRDVPGAGADVGFVLQPGSFVISGVVSDVVRLTYRPREGARIRTITRDSSGDLHESESPAVDAASSEADRQAAENVYGEAVAPVVARVGIARNGRWGEIALGMEHRMRDGGLHAVPASAWSASWRLPSDRVPVRVGMTRGTGSSGWEVGWISQSCSRPWSASIGRANAVGQPAAATAFSFSLGWRSARTCGRGR